MPGGEPNGAILPPNPEFPIPKYAPNQVAAETIVRPGVLMLPFFLGREAWRSKLHLVINRRLMAIQAVAERPLTQDEVNSVTTLASKKVYYERFGVPLGLLASAWASNRALMKDAEFRAYYHAEGRWVHPVEGVRALINMGKVDSINAGRILGNAGLRSIFWTLLALTGTNIVASFVETVGMATDPRLQAFRESSRRQTPEARIKKSQEAFKREAAEKKGSVTGPEAGQEEQDGQQEQERFGSVSAAASTGWESSSPSPSPSSRPQPSAEQPQGRGFFDDDDASPTAPEYRAAESKKQGGSAWDRIRQQNFSGSTQQDQRSSNSWEEASGSRSDTGSSSTPDWTRSRERQQSQAEFDRLVEAERSAGGDSWGGGKSW